MSAIMDSKLTSFTPLELKNLTWPQGLQVALAGVILAIIVTRFTRGKAVKYPPGPKPWPIVGNIPHMMHKDGPAAAITELTQKYGPIVFLRLGSLPNVILYHPKMVAEFLKEQDHIFSSRPSSIASRTLTYDTHDFAMAPYGNHWKHMRRVCVVELLSPKRLETFEPMRKEEASRLVKAVWSQHEMGKEVHLRHYLEAYAMNIMSRMILGKQYFGTASAGETDNKKVLELLVGTFEYFAIPNIGDFIPPLKYLDLQGLKKPLHKIHKELDKILQEVIDDKRRNRSKDGKSMEGDSGRIHDFVDVLLDLPGEDGEDRLPDGTIKALILNMMWSGTDTPIITTEWCMAEMVRNPHIQQRLRDEIDAVVGPNRTVEEADFVKLPYLKCCIKETFRVHPPGPFNVPRKGLEATTIGDYYLPANTQVMISNVDLGRNPEVWPEPLEYQPERWLNQNLAMIADNEFRIVPFGAGRRGCPGSILAQNMVMLSVSRLVHTFTWAPPHGQTAADIDMHGKEGGVTPMLHPLTCVATPRNPIAA